MSNRFKILCVHAAKKKKYIWGLDKQDQQGKAPATEPDDLNPGAYKVE